MLPSAACFPAAVAAVTAVDAVVATVAAVVLRWRLQDRCHLASQILWPFHAFQRGLRIHFGLLMAERDLTLARFAHLGRACFYRSNRTLAHRRGGKHLLLPHPQILNMQCPFPQLLICRSARCTPPPHSGMGVFPSQEEPILGTYVTVGDREGVIVPAPDFRLLPARSTQHIAGRTAAAGVR